MNKNLFNSKNINVISATSLNEADGKAYELPEKTALCQYVMTGTYSDTYYASSSDQLTKTLDLSRKVDEEFIAKLALYAREKSFMKDSPAMLCAILVGRGRNDLVKKIFNRVIDSPKMLRNFAQIIRSGVVGRKSFGSSTKKLMQQWFYSRTEEQLFRGSIGNDPSIKDVIRMVRPKPSTPERDAMHRYLLDKDYDLSKLPADVQAFEAFKKEPSAVLPNVPFEMLTALPLTDNQWMQIARNASWTQTRMNLNTFKRHNVFAQPGLEEEIAAKLANPELIQKARVFPYQLLAAYLNTQDVPASVTNALQDAMEHAIANIPEINGKIYVCPDISGSMKDPITGHRAGATSKVSCMQVATLVAASILRRNDQAEVIPFSDHVVPCKLNPKDSVMTNVKLLTSLPSGGTDCSAPLQELNKRNAKGDLIIMVSDNQSWYQWQNAGYTFQRSNSTGMAAEWAIFKKRNPNAKLINIDIQPCGTAQVSDDKSILNIGGFSDNVWNVVEAFTSSNGATHWTDVISKVEL